MSAHVDRVGAVAPVRLMNESVRLSFGASVVDDVRRLAIDAAVRSHLVVVANGVI